jgi:ferredoxin
MKFEGKEVLICNCEQTMPLDGKKLAKACQAAGGEGALEINSQLCRSQAANFQAAAGRGGPFLVACTQEAPLFSELAEEIGYEGELGFFNIREAAGWSGEAEEAAPKMAALAADAATALTPVPSMPVASEGVCLVYGKGQDALEAANLLASRLDVTLILTGEEEVIPPGRMEVPVFKGRITQAKGYLGQFALNLDGHAAATPSSRGALTFEAGRNNVFTECDLILDLTGGAPLFGAHERRDGYYRPDRGNPAAVMKTVFEIADMVGEFEKPRYVRYDASICAHGRSRKVGCTRCLDGCPTGAIRSLGDSVEIDPLVCAGCGVCASVCPTGAASYQLPGGDSLFLKLRALLTAYDKAGGEGAVLLLHDESHGAEMISLLSRFGEGLPARVLPLAVNEVTEVGIDFFTSAFAFGAERILIVVGPDKKGELEGLASQIGLAETIMEGLGYGGGRIALSEERDPEALGKALAALPKAKAAKAGSFLPIGGKRSRTNLALAQLHKEAPEPRDLLPLPKGAPFGAVLIDVEGCTMCLACVGACPTGALVDDPDRPFLGFREDACVQCGLCKNTCPESVISLQPRLNFTPEAREVQEKNRAEPFNCIRCGKPFAVAQSVETILDKLADKHWMFMGTAAADRIKMCEDCRVSSQFEEENPLAGGARPKIRTTDDYLRDREQGILDDDEE